MESNNNHDDVEFFYMCVVQVYGVAMYDDKWVKLPTYKEKFTSYFTDVAKRIERFFIRNNDWSALLNNKKLRNGPTCKNLLYVIAARYSYFLKYFMFAFNYSLSISVT